MDNEEGFNTPEQSPPGTPIIPAAPLGNTGGTQVIPPGAIQVTPQGGHPLMGNNPVGNNMGNPMNGNQIPQNLFFDPVFPIGDDIQNANEMNVVTDDEEDDEGSDMEEDDDANQPVVVGIDADGNFLDEDGNIVD